MGGRRLVAVVIGVGAVAGCSGDAEPGDETPAGTPPAVTATTAEANAGAGDAPATSATPSAAAGPSFVEVVRAELPEVARDRSDAEIQAIADSACADLAADRSADDVVAAARTLGTLDAEAADHATARELIKLAIDLTCPGQARRVDEF